MRHLIALLVLLLLAAAASRAAVPAPLEGHLLPTAPWTGRLLLPAEEDRRPDGGVTIELHTWPEGSVPGAREGCPQAIVVWRNAPFAPHGTDVTFDAATFDAAGGTDPASASLKLPWRLNGRRGVSALESLAGAHVEDDVEVALVEPRTRRDGSGALILEIRREPVVIAGPLTALVSFTDSSRPGILEGRLWDRSTKSFHGPTLVCRTPRDMVVNDSDEPALRRPLGCVEDIETSPMNREGWYVYGRMEGDDFLVEALEPRRLTRVALRRRVVGKAAAGRFIDQDMWSDERLSTYRGDVDVCLLTSRDETMAQSQAAFAGPGPYLVLHTFGGWGVDGTLEQTLLRTGHFSFGEATVGPCPITGEPRLSIVHWQVYATNGQGIISSTVAWHAYGGSLRRGWAFLRPMWETVVDLPELMSPYPTAHGTVDPHAVLRESLQGVMAAYRTGHGRGLAPVTVLNSCVQDSTQGLFLAFERMFGAPDAPWSAARSFPALRSLLSGEPSQALSDADAERWTGLAALYGIGARPRQRTLGDEFFRTGPMGISMGRVWREDWVQNLQEPGTFRAAASSSAVRDVLDAHVGSRNSIMPRHAHDTYLKTFLDGDARILSLTTSQVGGRVDGAVAYAPDKLSWGTVRGLVGRSLRSVWTGLGR